MSHVCVAPQFYSFLLPPEMPLPPDEAAHQYPRTDKTFQSSTIYHLNNNLDDLCLILSPFAPPCSKYSNPVDVNNLYTKQLYLISDLLIHVRMESYNSPISQRFFPLRWAARTPQISSWVITTQCQLYSNISQILLLYKTWRYYSKFDSTKLLGVRYRCVKISQCG